MASRGWISSFLRTTQLSGGQFQLCDCGSAGYVPRISQETVAVQVMLTRFAERLGRKAESVAGGTTYGNGEFPQWLAEPEITPLHAGARRWRCSQEKNLLLTHCFSTYFPLHSQFEKQLGRADIRASGKGIKQVYYQASKAAAGTAPCKRPFGLATRREYRAAQSCRFAQPGFDRPSGSSRVGAR